MKKMNLELSSACKAVMQAPEEEHVVALLGLWSPWRGRQRGIGSGAYERYCTLGLFAHGGNAPSVTKASSMKEACIAVNHFLRDRFPNGTWTSIAVLPVLLNPRIGMHRDMQNMAGKPNHAITLGSFTGGRVWIEDDEGTSTEKLAKNNKAFELKGSWIDIHDKPVSFNTRCLHKTEPHEGHMWALAAYTPQSFRRCSSEVLERLESLKFPLPPIKQ